MEFIIILLVLLAAVAAFIVSRFIHHGNPFPFHKKTQLFTHIERSFLHLLERAVGGQYKIINRVKLADILELKDNADNKTRRAAALKLNASALAGSCQDLGRLHSQAATHSNQAISTMYCSTGRVSRVMLRPKAKKLSHSLVRRPCRACTADHRASAQPNK